MTDKEVTRIELNEEKEEDMNSYLKKQKELQSKQKFKPIPDEIREKGKKILKGFGFCTVCNRHKDYCECNKKTQTPLDTLKMKFVNNEITEDQYNRMKKVLEG